MQKHSMSNFGIIYSKVVNNVHTKKFSQFIVGGMIAVVLGYAGNYLINKNLSKEDLGLFSYYYNLMTLLASVFSLGFYNAYLRFNNESFNTYRLIKIVRSGSIIISLLLFFVAYLIFDNIFIASFSFFILFNERIYYFRSEKKVTRMNLLKYIYSFILIICLVCFVKFNNLTFDKALVSYGIAYLIVFCLGLWDEKKKVRPVDKDILTTGFMLKFTIPTVITTILLWVSHFSDQMIMKECLSLTDLGNYAIACRIIVVIQIFTSLFLLYYPMLYFEESDKKNFVLIKKIRYAFILLLLLVTVFLIVGRKYLYILLGASQYLDYTDIFIYLAIAEFIRIVAGFYLIFRTFTLQNWYGTVAIGISAFISLILNIVFMPKYGIYFAAFVQVFAAVLYFTITYFVAIKPERKYFKYANNANNYLKLPIWYE